MKKLNFASAYKGARCSELRLWFLATSVVVVGGTSLVLLINIAHAPAMYRAYVRQAELVRLTRNEPVDMAQHTRLTKECADYRTRVAKLERRRQDVRSPLLYLRSLAAGSAHGIQLQQMRFDKHSIELAMGCRDPQLALKVAQDLRELPSVATISLVSLEAHQGEKIAVPYSCAMRGRLKSERQSD